MGETKKFLDKEGLTHYTAGMKKLINEAEGTAITEEEIAETFGAIEVPEGSGSSGGTSDAVQYIEQALTEDQQMQARKNLDLYRTEMGVLFPETTVESDEYWNGAMPLDIVLENGCTYKVKWNGTEYTHTSSTIADNGLSYIAIGNVAAYTGTGNTGEPFVIAYCSAWGGVTGNAKTLMVPLDGSTSATVEIKGPKVSMIPQKYYEPGTFFVDIWEVDDGAGNKTNVTSATYGQVKAAMNSGKQIVVRAYSAGAGSSGDVEYLVIHFYLYVAAGFVNGSWKPVNLVFYNPGSNADNVVLSTPEGEEPSDDTVYTVGDNW